VSLIYAAGAWTGPLSLGGENPGVLSLPVGCSVVVRNQTGGALLAVIEDLSWSGEATPAASVLEVPEFRKLFPDERPDLARLPLLEPGRP
jgi:hypothetical protein